MAKKAASACWRLDQFGPEPVLVKAVLQRSDGLFKKLEALLLLWAQEAQRVFILRRSIKTTAVSHFVGWKRQEVKTQAPRPTGVCDRVTEMWLGTQKGVSWNWLGRPLVLLMDVVPEACEGCQAGVITATKW